MPTSSYFICLKLGHYLRDYSRVPVLYSVSLSSSKEMHLSRCSDLCLGLRTILFLVAKMNSLAVLFNPNLNFSITDPGCKAPDPGSGSARTDYVFSTPKNVAMLAEI